jgi:hypothetical protein
LDDKVGKVGKNFWRQCFCNELQTHKRHDLKKELLDFGGSKPCVLMILLACDAPSP